MRALLFVRNPFVHDARVRRAALTLRAAGYDPLVVAVTSTTVRRRAEVADGVAVLRLDPTSPFSVARRLVHRGGSGGAAAAPAPAPAAPAGPLVRLHRLLRTLDFYRRGIGVLRRERPVLVHCNDFNTMWIGVAARALGAAVVYDSHELWADRNGRPEPRWWLLVWEALFVRVAHVVVAASPGYADALARRYRVPRPAVVLNVPDAPAPEASAPVEPDLAIYAGGLQPHRGIERAIAAVAEVPGLRLRLMGPGRPEYVESLRALARDRGVADRVEFRAPVPPERVVEAVRGAAFGVALFEPVCLSHRLVAPNKLFEYLAAGLPALVSDLPVMAGYVRDGAGVAAAPDAVADAARALLDPERNRRAREAAAAAGGRLRWERERGVLERCYERAVTSARSASHASAAAARE